AIKVDTNGPAPVKGNRELISQALANLIDNAIKYAAPKHAAPALAPASPDMGSDAAVRNPDSPVVVRARSEDDHVLLTVADAGPGIPVADRERVLERFVRLEQSRSESGAGLGLSLAAAVARLHRGELKLEENAPGLKVIIMLPKA